MLWWDLLRRWWTLWRGETRWNKVLGGREGEVGEGREEQDLGEGSCAVEWGFEEEGRLKRGVGWCCTQGNARVLGVLLWSHQGSWRPTLLRGWWLQEGCHVKCNSGVVTWMGDSSRSLPCPHLPLESPACCYWSVVEMSELSAPSLAFSLSKTREQCLDLELFVLVMFKQLLEIHGQTLLQYLY